MSKTLKINVEAFLYVFQRIFDVDSTSRRIDTEIGRWVRCLNMGVRVPESLAKKTKVAITVHKISEDNSYFCEFKNKKIVFVAKG